MTSSERWRTWHTAQKSEWKYRSTCIKLDQCISFVKWNQVKDYHFSFCSSTNLLSNSLSSQLFANVPFFWCHTRTGHGGTSWRGLARLSCVANLAQLWVLRSGGDHKLAIKSWAFNNIHATMKVESIMFWLYIYIYPQTGTFADPETHPLRAFVPFLPGRVLAFGLFFFAFFVASRASVHTWHGYPNLM